MPTIPRTATTSRPTCPFDLTRPAPGPGRSAGICRIARPRATTSARDVRTPIPCSSTPTSTDRRTRARSGASPRRSDTSWRNWNTQTPGLARRQPRFRHPRLAACRTAGPWRELSSSIRTTPPTYQTDPNRIRDYDATNKPWPEVVAELLGFYGFGMRWVCEDDGYGQPYDYLEVYRKDAAGPTDPKQIYLPPKRVRDLSTALANVAAMHAAFDYQAVANSFFIETAPRALRGLGHPRAGLPAAGRRRDSR